MDESGAGGSWVEGLVSNSGGALVRTTTPMTAAMANQPMMPINKAPGQCNGGGMLGCGRDGEASKVSGAAPAQNGASSIDAMTALTFHRILGIPRKLLIQALLAVLQTAANKISDRRS